jgi:hypothetical protein
MPFNLPPPKYTAPPLGGGAIALGVGGTAGVAVFVFLLLYFQGAPPAHAWIGVWRDARGRLPASDPRRGAVTTSVPPTPLPLAAPLPTDQQREDAA